MAKSETIKNDNSMSHDQSSEKTPDDENDARSESDQESHQPPPEEDLDQPQQEAQDATPSPSEENYLSIVEQLNADFEDRRISTDEIQEQTSNALFSYVDAAQLPLSELSSFYTTFSSPRVNSFASKLYADDPENFSTLGSMIKDTNPDQGTDNAFNLPNVYQLGSLTRIAASEKSTTENNIWEEFDHTAYLRAPKADYPTVNHTFYNDIEYNELDPFLFISGSRFNIQNSGRDYNFDVLPNGVLRFEVRSGDFYANETAIKERSEVYRSNQPIMPDTHVDISYTLNIEAGSTNTADWLVLGQLQSTPAGSPPASIHMFGERMAVVVSFTDSNGNPASAEIYRDSADITRGHDYNIEIHVTVNADNMGHLTVVRDGVQLVDYEGSVGYDDSQSYYWKEGIYREAADETLVVTYSSLQITTSPGVLAVPTTVPVIAFAQEHPSGDTGVSNTDGITSSDWVRLNGTATAGAIVTIYDNGVAVATMQTNGVRNWTYSAHLAEGTHLLTATATLSGLTSTIATGNSFTIDETINAPVISGISPDDGSLSTDGITTSKALVITGTAEANSTVTVKIDGTTIGTTVTNSSGNWFFDNTANILSNGNHLITARAIDLAGNTSAQSSAFYISTVSDITNNMMLGAYVRTNEMSSSAMDQTYREVETWLGRDMNFVSTHSGSANFADWTSSVSWAASIYSEIFADRDILWSIPLIAETQTTMTAAASGAYDVNYVAAAQTILNAASGNDHTIYIRTGWEMNAFWSPVSAYAHNQESAYIGAWQHFVDAFRSVSDRFQFVWCPNVGTDGSVNAEDAYPGDAYVDVIAMDFYWDSQQAWSNTDPVQAWNYMLTQSYGLNWLAQFASAHNKPISIPEWGVNSDDAAYYLEQSAIWFKAHDVIYANYWETNSAFSGKMSEEQYPNTAFVYKMIFGMDSMVVGTSAGGETLLGDNHNNFIDGVSASSGYDTLIGYKGDDTYAVHKGTDVIIEQANEGIDTVLSFSSSYTLGNNIENLSLNGETAQTGIGNALDNEIRTGSGADTITGGLGADTFIFDSHGLGSIDTITDFSLAQGDKLKFDHLLDGFDPLQDAITDFIHITQSGSNSIVSIDQSGSGSSWTQIATLQNTTGLTDEAALHTSGNIVI